MPRLEIELTSKRDDGSWTWRAAGAKQPKGTLDGALLPDGISTGAVVRAETEVDIDGITVVSVEALGGEARDDASNRIEIIGTGRDEPGVITNLAPKSDRKGRGKGPKGRGRDRGERGPRGDRGDRGGRGGPRGDRGDRSDRGDRGPRGERRSRPERPAPPPVPKKPKPKRLRPGRAHRDALVASLPPEHQPIAEKLHAGGMAAVRKAIDEQNVQAKAEGHPEVPAAPLLAAAEELHPRLRAAEWLDRAEAAKADLDELSLKDLRSVVAAAGDAAKDEQGRALAEELRAGLDRRVEAAHEEWVADVKWSLEAGRVVRALRVSSRPPDPKRHLPDDVLAALKEAGGAALAADVVADRWAVVLEAVSFSPVRHDVEPAGLPAEPGDELLAAVSKAAQRVPQIAARFGIDVKAPPGSRKRRPAPPPPPPPPPPAASAPPTPAAPAVPAAPEAPAVPDAPSAPKDEGTGAGEGQSGDQPTEEPAGQPAEQPEGASESGS